MQRRNYASENSMLEQHTDTQFTPFLGCWRSPHILSHQPRLEQAPHHASTPPFLSPLAVLTATVTLTVIVRNSARSPECHKMKLRINFKRKTKTFG